MIISMYYHLNCWDPRLGETVCILISGLSLAAYFLLISATVHWNSGVDYSFCVLFLRLLLLIPYSIHTLSLLSPLQQLIKLHLWPSEAQF
jgi:hypothetical protein